MSISLYQISAPVFTRLLGNLQAILEKTAAHARSRNIGESVFLESRLYPDMFALARQVQRVADIAVGGVARVAGVPVPVLGDEAPPTTFADASERIDRAIDFLSTVSPAQIDGREEFEVSFKRRDQAVTLAAQTYLLTNVIPNFYFHLTTAYGILRHNGVEIGKQDFLGRA